MKIEGFRENMMSTRQATLEMARKAGRSITKPEASAAAALVHVGAIVTRGLTNTYNVGGYEIWREAVRREELIVDSPAWKTFRGKGDNSQV